MSNDIPAVSSNIVPELLSLKDLGALLVKHYDLHEGVYDVVIEYAMGMGGVGPNSEDLLPGVFMAARKVGLARTDKPSNRSVDAAIVNPAKKAKTIKKKVVEEVSKPSPTKKRSQAKK